MVGGVGNNAKPGVNGMREVNSMSEVNAHGCTTVSQLFWKRVNETPDKVALREKDFGIWNEYSWRDYGDHARWVGHGLKARIRVVGFDRWTENQKHDTHR